MRVRIRAANRYVALQIIQVAAISWHLAFEIYINVKYLRLLIETQ